MESFSSTSIKKSSNNKKKARAFSGENEEIAVAVMMTILNLSEDDRLLGAVLIGKVKEQKERVNRGFYFEVGCLGVNGLFTER